MGDLLTTWSHVALPGIGAMAALGIMSYIVVGIVRVFTLCKSQIDSID